MKLGLMSAIPEEISVILNDMALIKAITLGGRCYYQGVLHGIDTVIVFSNMGKVAAAITATTLITTFKVDAICFTGVAGAVDMGLNIGDVVIAEQLYQHDLDARPLASRYEIPGTGKSFLPADLTLTGHVVKAVNTFFDKILVTAVSPASIHAYALNDAKAVLGIVASGDQFMTDSAHLKRLKQEVPGLCAVEMEGAAVAQVCTDYKLPFAVLRIISDSANHTAAIDFQSFIQDVAGQYARAIIATTWQQLAKDARGMNITSRHV